MADSYFNFISENEIVLLTTGFTRIRIPIIVTKNRGSKEVHTEKLVLMTSYDRTIVAAIGSRVLPDTTSIPRDVAHSTPILLYVAERDDFSIAIETHSAGGMKCKFDIPYEKELKKFKVPSELDVKSKQFQPREFDADIPTRGKRKWN